MTSAKSSLVVLLGVLSLTTGVVLAADKDQVLREQSEKLMVLLNENQLRKIADNVGLFKEAGLSYQPSLVVPVEGILGCKNSEQKGILVGMYTFDANYALLFGKKQEFAAANELRYDIPNRLDLTRKLKFRTFTPGELEQVLDNPDDPANRQVYVKYAAAHFHDMLEAAKSDEQILGLFMDSSYGAILESLYVSCRLALAAGTGERLVSVFNEQAARLEKLTQALAAYAEDPELEALTKRSQREAVIKPVADILEAKQGKLAEADVVKILSLVEPERSKIVAKCQ